jgi:hypothetical protein
VKQLNELLATKNELLASKNELLASKCSNKEFKTE